MNEYNPAALIPDYQSLMLPVLRAFEKDVVRIGVVIKKLSDDLDLGEAASILLPSGRQTVFANRVHWAKTYLAKAGLVEAHATWPFSSGRARRGSAEGRA